jgi:hypothetical protein
VITLEQPAGASVLSKFRHHFTSPDACIAEWKDLLLASLYPRGKKIQEKNYGLGYTTSPHSPLLRSPFFNWRRGARWGAQPAPGCDVAGAAPPARGGAGQPVNPLFFFSSVQALPTAYPAVNGEAAANSRCSARVRPGLRAGAACGKHHGLGPFYPLSAVTYQELKDPQGPAQE